MPARPSIPLALDLALIAICAVGDLMAADAPEITTTGQLVGLLQDTLGPESALVPLPFLADEELAQWARELTAECDGPAERARALHDALAPLRAPRGKGRTALQVLSQRSSESAGFGASELARLYVALARSVGLRAVCVHVTADPLGRSINEICAGVYLAERVFLVDPGFQASVRVPVRLADGKIEERHVVRIFVSYDIKHRRSRPLSDIETTAAFCGERALLLSDPQEAVRLASIGVRLAPELPLAHAQLARVHLAHGRLQQATDSARRACGLDGQNAIYRVLLGEALLASNQTKEAEAAFQEAIRLDGQYFDALVGLAWLKYLAGDFESAADLSDRAARADPQRPPALTVLGLALLCDGKPREAVRAYERAIETYGQSELRTAASDLMDATLTRGLVAGHYCLGLLYEATGLSAEARSSFRAYLRLAPTGEFAAQAQERVRSSSATPGDR